MTKILKGYCAVEGCTRDGFYQCEDCERRFCSHHTAGSYDMEHGRYVYRCIACDMKAREEAETDAY